MDSTATTAQVLHRVQAHIDAERCDEARALLDCLPDDDLGTARMRAAIAAKEYALGRLSNAQLREQVRPALARLLREVDPRDDFQCLALYSLMGSLDRELFEKAARSPSPAVRTVAARELLRFGDYPAGFSTYLARFDAFDRATRLSTDRLRLLDVLPRWQGEPLIGKTAVLLCEQGHGDAIMLARFFGALRWAERCIGVARPALSRLFSHTHPWIEWVTQYDAKDADSQTVLVPAFDLPAHLGVTADTVRVRGRYLRLNPFLADATLDLGPRMDGLRVGICWRGSPDHFSNGRRSVKLATLAPLFDVPAVTFYSLCVNDGEEVRSTRAPLRSLHWLHSFDETAAAISRMDLVITVDTAVAHLAGALNVPVWIMLQTPSDWRWGVSADRTPWYESARLFRQDDDSTWQPVIDRVAEALRGASPPVWEQQLPPSATLLRV